MEYPERKGDGRAPDEFPMFDVAIDYNRRNSESTSAGIDGDWRGDGGSTGRQGSV